MKGHFCILHEFEFRTILSQILKKRTKFYKKVTKFYLDYLGVTVRVKQKKDRKKKKMNKWNDYNNKKITKQGLGLDRN